MANSVSVAKSAGAPTQSQHRLVIVGQGYVGLPLAVRAAAAGLTVVGLDVDQGVVASLNSGRSHIVDVSNDDMAATLRYGYRATENPAALADADVIVVCVPTPLDECGNPDLGSITRAASVIAGFIKPGTLVVLESTSYPGTTEEVFAPIISRGRYRIGVDIYIAFSPERIDPGNREFGVGNTPKIVGGITAICAAKASSFYERFVERVVIARGTREAEMSKLLENTFRHLNIALINELAQAAHEMNIDIWDVISCAETKPFGFMAFRPGPGVGGHCIPVDPNYLSHFVMKNLGHPVRLIELSESINTSMPLYVVDRVVQLLEDHETPVAKSQVLLLGVTYKADVADRRNSPADEIAELLMSRGAEISYHDPFFGVWTLETSVRKHEFTRIDDVYERAQEFDVVILLQPHSVYDLKLLCKRSHLVLDTRGVFESSPNVHRL